MLPQRSPRRTIINVSSNFPARKGRLEPLLFEQGCRFNVSQMTHLEYGNLGIRAVSSPGTVATDMQVAMRASGINPISQLSPESHSPVERPAEIIQRLY